MADSLELSQPFLAAGQRELTNAIREQALRTSELVNKVLDMARLQAGGMRLNRQWQSLEEVIGSALKAREALLADHHVEVRLPVELQLLEFDAVLIERVLVNLLENAAKYTPAGSEISVEAVIKGKDVEIAVEDNGPGLPPGMEQAIFEKFIRGTQESAKAGIGLGLAICKAIVEAHQAASGPRTDLLAARALHLPCRWVPRRRWNRKSAWRTPRSNLMSSATPTILVVEDDKEIRRFVRLALETDGCHVVEAEGYQRGLIEAGTRQPDLLMLDLELPDGDGIAFIRELRGWSSLPILVLSARSQETDKIQALDTGADDYLTKPFGVGELLARVRAVLRRQSHAGDAGQTVVTFGDIRVDLVRRVVEKAGQPVHLTPLEYRLLALLLQHASKVLTHRQLLREVWGPSYVESAHYLRVYMGHLRQKLEDDPTRSRYLITETGVGYRFVG